MRRTVVIVAVALAGCAGAASGEPHPGPPPTSHTVDATGSADNAGRTSDEVIARPETAGVRPTELGGNRPTGTNTGFPVGARTRITSAPSPPPRPPVVPRPGESPVADYADEPGKIGAELCDREAVCGRVGTGRAFESARACGDAMRPRVTSELGAMGCRIDPGALAACLARIHATPCAQALDRLGALPECATTPMCAR